MLSESEQKAASAIDADIGSALRDARTIAGISLEDVSRRTRISKSFLEFIELNQFDKLPGVGYIPGFIRNYCTAISVDPTPYIEAFKASLNETDAKPEYKFHVQALVPKMAGSVVAMIAVAAALSGYIGWTIMGSNQSAEPVNVAQSSLVPADDVLQQLSEQESLSATVSPLIDSTAAPLAGAPENASEASLDSEQQTDSAVSEAVPIQDEEEIAEAPAAISPSPVSDAETVESSTPDAGSSAQPIASRDTSSAGAQATARQISSELIIKATSTSWVEIVRADGEVSVSKLMRSGDSLVASIGDNLFLSTGNAGGLTLQTSTIEPFAAGNVGEILRDLPLNFDALVTRRDLSTY